MVRGFMFAKDRLEYEFLPAALEIEQTPPSPLGRFIIWFIVFVFITALTWSIIGRVDEVAVARGKIIPDGRIKVIQPVEEGRIKAIHVQEGQQVKEGELLIELDTTMKQADVDSLNKTLALAKLEREVLLSELNDADAQNLTPNIEKGSDSSKTKELLALQLQFQEARKAEFSQREEATKLIVEQRKSDLDIEQIELGNLEKKYMLSKLNQQEKKTTYKSPIDSLNQTEELDILEQEIESQKKKITRSAKGMEEAEKNLESLRSEKKRTVLQDILEKEKTITAVEAQLLKAQTTYNYQRLVSPVNGIVQGVSSNTIGGVVTPAQPIVSVVPEETPLIVEATVLNTDIGFIQVGQEVEVKLDTFPFQKYGTVPGKVESISPDAVDDQKLGPVYKIKVSFLKKSFHVGNQEVLILPGMTGNAEIKTGKRRIIEFFLSPVIKGLKESLELR